MNRTSRRQYLVRHLVACGPRPVLEALIAVAGGADLDATLEDYARLSPEIFAAVDADVLPIDDLAVVDGGRP
jgi:ABC-type hemin transport system substrate-binding protein